MLLNNNSLKDKEFWESKGYVLPRFDRGRMIENTKKSPVWVHFGAGNIFRAFIAVLQQRLLDSGLQDKGIIVAEGYDYELIDRAYRPFDDLSIAVTLMPDGNMQKQVTGSVAESVKAGIEGMKRLREIFTSDSLQIVSFTITEKGYDIPQGSSSVLTDSKQKPDNMTPEIIDKMTFLEKLTLLCLHRYQKSAAPLALVSMDNCSHNGVLLQKAVRYYAALWVNAGITGSGFLNYIDDPELLSFPCTMIDKITPYPDDNVSKQLSGDGISNMESFTTAKGSVTAPFVNAERPEYLIVEDVFPNGRPPLECAGVIFTDRDTVDKVEKMKVCTCLNPLHTAASVFACMLGYTKINDAMRDTDIKKLVMCVAKEGLEVVTDPGIISPGEFLDTVINERLPNPYIPDTPQRIMTDTSRKLAVRFGETIKSYSSSKSLDVRNLHAVPLVLAGWCRYLLGTDDEGKKYELSPDPMLETLCPLLKNISSGDDADYSEMLKPILVLSDIFGADLYEAGIADRVVEYFSMMAGGNGAVRSTLRLMDN